VKEIADRIFVATDFARVTVGAVLTGEGWVCIDSPPYPRDAQAWRARLKAVSHLPVQYVVNTDHHRDHILGNVWLDGRVVAHTHAAEVMLALRNGFITQAAEDLSVNDNELVEIASVKPVAPEISFSDTMSLMCGEREFQLSHHPSATKGSLWVTLAGEQVIFAGDSVVAKEHPVITEAASKEWLITLRGLRHDRFAEWKIVPGRGGELSDSDATEQLSEYLRVARRKVTKLLRSNRPRSEVSTLASEFLPFFPVKPDTRDEALRRIRLGLDAIYEEMRNSQDDSETE
jgi:cyclase